MNSFKGGGGLRMAVLKASVVVSPIHIAILDVWEGYVVRHPFHIPIWERDPVMILLAILASWAFTALGLCFLVFAWLTLPIRISRRVDQMVIFVLLGASIAIVPFLFDGLYGRSTLWPFFAVFGAISALTFALMNFRRFSKSTGP